MKRIGALTWRQAAGIAAALGRHTERFLGEAGRVALEDRRRGTTARAIVAAWLAEPELQGNCGACGARLFPVRLVGSTRHDGERELACIACGTWHHDIRDGVAMRALLLRCHYHARARGEDFWFRMHGHYDVWELGTPSLAFLEIVAELPGAARRFGLSRLHADLRRGVRPTTDRFGVPDIAAPTAERRLRDGRVQIGSLQLALLQALRDLDPAAPSSLRAWYRAALQRRPLGAGAWITCWKAARRLAPEWVDRPTTGAQAWPDLGSCAVRLTERGRAIAAGEVPLRVITRTRRRHHQR